MTQLWRFAIAIALVCMLQGLAYVIGNDTAIHAAPALGMGGLVLAATVVTFGRRKTLVQEDISHRLELAREKERIDLASDIHDGPLQDLYATRFLLTGPSDANDQLERLLAKVRSELREITMRLESPKLENGLSDALRQLVDWYEEKMARPSFRFISIGNDDVIPADVALALFRMARTAIANVHKHSEATTVDLACIVDRDVLTLVIKDDGKGFDMAALAHNATEHCGLFLMQHYAEEIGGALEVISRPGDGTMIQIQWKLRSSKTKQDTRNAINSLLTWNGR